MTFPNIERRVVPPRGSRGSNQAIIRAMEKARYVEKDGKVVLEGEGVLVESRAKGNSFWSSGKKMGLKIIRRTEEGGKVRCWVLDPEEE